jgi:hypothetical protein
MKKLLLISILISCSLLSCSADSPYDAAGTVNSEEENIEKENSKNPVPDGDWIIKTITPLPEYDAYFFMPSSGGLYGIDGITLDLITPEDTEGQKITLLNFFTKFGKIYFRTYDPEDIETEILCTQDDYGIITVLIEGVSPKMIDRVEYDSSEFIITTAEYAGEPVSDVYDLVSESGVDRYKMIDSFHHFPGVALWFNSPDAREPVRYPGLYRRELGKSGVSKMKEPGIIWSL